MQRQGTYKCPKCGSKDSYEGTTLVSAGGIGMAREIGDTGDFVGASSSSTRERTVRKCRNCAEILGKKDYVPTAQEVEEARKSASSADIILWMIVLVCAGVGGYCGGVWDGSKWDELRGAFVTQISFVKVLVGIALGAVAGFVIGIGITSQSD